MKYDRYLDKTVALNACQTRYIARMSDSTNQMIVDYQTETNRNHKQDLISQTRGPSQYKDAILPVEGFQCLR